jgi:hypothetical protein
MRISKYYVENGSNYLSSMFSVNNEMQLILIRDRLFSTKTIFTITKMHLLIKFRMYLVIEWSAFLLRVQKFPVQISARRWVILIEKSRCFLSYVREYRDSNQI